MIVEASLNHPESVNRTNFNCIENGLPSVCMDLTLCFSYKGKEVPGYIGKGALNKLMPDRMCTSLINLLVIFRALSVFHHGGDFRAGESSHLITFPLHLPDSRFVLTNELDTLRL